MSQKRLLNSNDIFSQIGLILDQSEHNSLKDKNMKHIRQQQDKTFADRNKAVQFPIESETCIASLQIQLGDDESYILQIKPNDDPVALARNFCKQHNLNNLAINIVQSKIRQAQQKNKMQLEKPGLNYQSKYPAQGSPKKKDQAVNPKQRFQQRESNIKNNPYIDNANRSNAKSTRGIFVKQDGQLNRSKKQKSFGRLSKSPVKQIKGKQKNHQQSDSLYHRGVMAKKVLQQRRRKQQLQRQRQMQQDDPQLTFKPKINNVSQKIVQFRKQNPQDKKKKSPPKPIYKELQQCTFKPVTNKVSNIIVRSIQSRSKQSKHFEKLYRNKKQASRVTKKSYQEQSNTFHPVINQERCSRIQQPFMLRMQKAIDKKNHMQGINYDKQCSFQPKICRAPKGQKKRDKQNQPVWQHLYCLNAKKTEQKSLYSKVNSQKSITTNSSDYYYSRLIQNKINQVFAILDSDQDGYISPSAINIEDLSANSLTFLKPILVQLVQLQVKIGYFQFKKAVQKLIQDSDIHSKGQFLSQKAKHLKKNYSEFIPQINKKSQMIACQSRKTGDVYSQLYQKGLKEMFQKEAKIQQAKILKQQKQKEECSFKPMLNSSSRYYINKIFSNKNQKEQAQQDCHSQLYKEQLYQQNLQLQQADID